jgi:hypothetical protein
VEEKLNHLAAQSGKDTADLVHDARAGYFAELAQTRSTLDRRYDELKSGQVAPIPGEEVEACFRNESAGGRRSR